MLHYHQTAGFAGFFILKIKREVSAAVFRNSLFSAVCLCTVTEQQVLQRNEVFDRKPLKNKVMVNISSEKTKKTPKLVAKAKNYEEFLFNWSQAREIYSPQAWIWNHYAKNLVLRRDNCSRRDQITDTETDCWPSNQIRSLLLWHEEEEEEEE